MGYARELTRADAHTLQQLQRRQAGGPKTGLRRWKLQELRRRGYLQSESFTLTLTPQALEALKPWTKTDST